MANLSTQAYLQAQKDIREELAKEGKVYIQTSLKSIKSLCELDFIASPSWFVRPLAKGKDGKYNIPKRRLWY